MKQPHANRPHTTPFMWRLQAHFWSHNTDENARLAALAVDWITADTAADAAGTYAGSLTDADRALLRSVFVVPMAGPTTANPIGTANDTLCDDNRVLVHPNGTRYRMCRWEPSLGNSGAASFHWIASNEAGTAGRMVMCEEPASAPEMQRLAWAVLETARLHNASYIPGESEPDRATYGRHAVSIQDAADHVARDSNEAYLIGVMLWNAWNDACDWATYTLERCTAHPGDARDRNVGPISVPA